MNNFNKYDLIGLKKNNLTSIKIEFIMEFIV